ncbi:MAG TPA: hypothetical protein ENN77_02050, partial [Candidatus Wirthbacteria bacterium]|nr:hypothetical protein [Candidatus Wirthbacteria bacterium]
MLNRCRLQAFRKKIELTSSQAVLVHNQENVFYLSGMRGLTDFDIVLLLTQDQEYILTNILYEEYLSKSKLDYQVCNNIFQDIKQLISANKIQKLWIEGQHLPFDSYQKLKANLEIEIATMGNLPKAIRMYKSPQEVEQIKRACQIADQAWLESLNFIKQGMTEKELAW